LKIGIFTVLQIVAAVHK